jgi:hypothetical protein
MNTYEIRFKTKDGHYLTIERSAIDSGRAIVGWRRENPDAEMIWMKRKRDDLEIIRDRRLPREAD